MNNIPCHPERSEGPFVHSLPTVARLRELRGNRGNRANLKSPDKWASERGRVSPAQIAQIAEITFCAAPREQDAGGRRQHGKQVVVASVAIEATANGYLFVDAKRKADETEGS